MFENVNANPLALRVQGGTIPGDRDLCATCRWAVRRQSSVSGWTETRCNAVSSSPRVPERLAECNSYLDRNRLTLGEMVQIAWIVETKGKSIGFLTPEEVAKRRGFSDVSAPPTVGF